MGKLSKSMATELASTTQAIFRELRESISNPNPEKVFFIRKISTWKRPGLYRRQPNLPKQTLLSLKARISGKTISLKKTEKMFIESIRDTLEIEGTALLPAFAIGRTQEILMLLNTHGIKAYVDGMCRDVYKNPQRVSGVPEKSGTPGRGFRTCYLCKRQVEGVSSQKAQTAGGSGAPDYRNQRRFPGP